MKTTKNHSFKHCGKSPEERFFDKVIIKKEDECWLWNGSKYESGYGKLRFYGKVSYAHRIAYFLHNKVINNNLMVLHKCDNPSCVNPSHLYQGSYSDNFKDAIFNGKILVGEKHKQSKLKNSEVDYIIGLGLRGLNHMLISKMFKISRQLVSAITSGKKRKYTHVAAMPNEKLEKNTDFLFGVSS